MASHSAKIDRPRFFGFARNPQSSSRRKNKRSSVTRALTIGALSFIALGSWALSSPLGSTPDSLYHSASVWCSSFTDDDPCNRTFDDTPSWGIPMGLVESMCAVQNPSRSASCQSFIHYDDGRIARTADLNPATGLYPELFYKTMNLFVGPNIEHALIGMRLFNAGVFSFLVGVLSFLLPKRLWGSAIVSWVVTMVPLGVFFIPSINPSSWNIIGIGFAWIAILGFLETKGLRSASLGIVAIGTIVLATGARADGLAFGILSVVLALWLSDWSQRALWKKAFLPVGISATLGTMLFINPRQTGVAEEGFGVRPSNEEMPTVAPDSSSGIFWNNLLDTPSLWLGMIGGYPLGSLGWLDTVMPQIVVFSVFLVAVILSYLALHDRDWKKITAIIGGVILISAIPLYLLQLGGFLVGEEIQPRYLLPLLIVLMGVIFLPSRDNSRFILPPALVATGALLLAIANSAALHTNIRRYVTGITQGGLDLTTGKEWWWQSIPPFLTPNSVWLIGSLAFLAFAWTVLNTRSRITREISPGNPAQ